MAANGNNAMSAHGWRENQPYPEKPICNEISANGA
jgi:hypothetical protein